MQERVTPRMVAEIADELARRTGLPLRLEGAYGKYQLLIKRGMGWDTLSPFLSGREMIWWMRAFEKGFYLGREFTTRWLR